MLVEATGGHAQEGPAGAEARHHGSLRMVGEDAGNVVGNDEPNPGTLNGPDRDQAVVAGSVR